MRARGAVDPTRFFGDSGNFVREKCCATATIQSRSPEAITPTRARLCSVSLTVRTLTQSLFRLSTKRGMMRLRALWLVALFVVGAPVTAQSGKKVLTQADYDSWRSIQGSALSNDGQWVAYTVQPLVGEGELVV